MRKTTFLKLFSLLIFMASAFILQAQTFWTGGGGDNNWHNPLNWSAGMPDAANSAIIGMGNNVLLTADASCQGAIIDGVLTVGDFNLNAGANDLQGNGSTIVLSGSVTASSYTINNLTAGSGTINCSWNWNPVIFVAGASTVNFSGNGDLQASANFYNVNIAGGTRTTTADITVANNLTISGGILKSWTDGLGQSITMLGANSEINITAGTLSGTDEGVGNDLSLVCAGDNTTLKGTTAKFFSITVNAGKKLIAETAVQARYGVFRVDGIFQINTAGSVFHSDNDDKSPIYGANSTLIYNSGGTYGRYYEWSADGVQFTGATPGYPDNVQLSNNTTLELGANGGTGTERAIGNDLIIDAGSTMQMKGAFPMTQPLTIGDELIINGTFELNGLPSYLVLFGDYTNNGTLIHNDGVIAFTAFSHIQTGGVGVGKAFYNVSFSGLPVTLNSTMDINGGLHIAGGTSFAVNGAHDIYLAGDWTSNGDFSSGTGTVFFDGNSQIVTGGVADLQDFNNIRVSGTATLTEPIDIDGNFRVTGTFNAAGFDMTVAGNWRNEGTFNHGNNTVTFDGVTSMRSGGTAVGKQFYNLTINATNVDLAEEIDIDNNLTTNGGAFNCNGYTVNLGGSLTHNAGTINHGNNTFIFDGAAIQYLAVAGVHFYDLTLDGNEVRLNEENYIDHHFLIENGRWNANGQDMFVKGNWTNKDIFMHLDNVVRFMGNSTIITGSNDMGSSPFYDLIIEGTAALSTNKLHINHNFEITATGNFNANSLDMYPGALWKNRGTFTPGNNTVYVYNTVIQAGGNVAGRAFNNLTSNTLSTLAEDIAIGGNLVMNSGDFNAAGYHMYVGGNWYHAGTFNHGNNTVTFNGAGNSFVYEMVQTPYFYNLEVNKTSGEVEIRYNTEIRGNLILTNGNINMKNGGTLMLEANSQVQGSPSSNSMVLISGGGKMRKYFAGNGNFTFPIGEETGTVEYSPLEVNFTSGTYAGGSFVETYLKNLKHPDNTTTSSYLNRYWNLRQAGITAFNCDVTCHYLDADVVGSENKMVAGKYDTPNWTAFTKNETNNTLIFNGLSSFSDFTGVHYKLFDGNYALAFDGNDHVNLGTPSVFQPAGNNFTYEFQLKTNNRSFQGVLVKRNVGSNSSYLACNIVEGRMEVWLNNKRAFAATETADGNWHHYALVRDGSNFYLYIDGVKENWVGVIGSESVNNNDNLVIGKYFSSLNLFHMNAEMDELRVWNTVRSVAEINANMHTELSGNEAGLQAYYNFNQKALNFIPDQTSNANNATKNGNPQHTAHTP